MRPSRPSPHRHPVLLALVALLALGAAPRAHAAPASAGPDYGPYQALLDDYLMVVSGPKQPLDTRFDYETLYDVRGQFERMSRIRAALLAVPPSQMDSLTRRAWAINTYNFLVLQHAVQYLLVPGHGRQRYKQVNSIKLPTGSFFQGAVVQIEGKDYSLDEFEKTFLFDGFDRLSGQPAPATLDPRYHFALVCGAMGCPPLLPRAYRPDSLERQLEFATRNALALPRHLRYDAAAGRLWVSMIFQWYSTDFGGYEKSFEFLKRYAPKAVRATIEAKKLTRPGAYIKWDWDLNQFPHKATL